jgi:hypothetical protein
MKNQITTLNIQIDKEYRQKLKDAGHKEMSLMKGKRMIVKVPETIQIEIETIDKNKYTVDDLNVHIYGRGRNKKFIMYTDYDSNINKWYTRVYPDIEGNKVKAIRQVLRWLNNPSMSIKYAVFTEATKISLSYDGPLNYSETDCDGEYLM